MQLGQLIEALEAAEHKEGLVRWGFSAPHASRGYYEELAFDPAENVSIASMLASALSARDATFEAWKGGTYTMAEHTKCWIEAHGNWDANGISAQLVNYWMVETGNAARVSIRSTYP